MVSEASPGSQAQSARIFLSYKRNVEPDASLARKIEAELTARGHSVFIDHKLVVGQDWAEEIETRLRGSDFLIVFLTDASSRSEMVKKEVELARRNGEENGRPRILPVRIAFAGGLPYPLNAFLDRLQYAMWRGEKDTQKLVSELHGVVCGCAVELPVEQAELSTPAADLPPAYSAPLPAPGGALDIEDPWYITRPSDRMVLSSIRQTGKGQTLILRGPRQMGKSSLLMRTVAAAMEVGKRVVLLDFQLLDQKTRDSSDLFFHGFASDIAQQLDLSDKMDECWGDSSHPQNCTRFLENCVLKKMEESLVLAIDEVDILFDSPFRSDFYGMLRHWHNVRANPAKRVWRKLDLVLVTSTEPYMFIDKVNVSPFNVGESTYLSDLQIEQVSELNRLHHSPLFPQEVDRIYELLRGHPYLTRKALYVLSQGFTPEELFQNATEDIGPFGDHLRHYLLHLQSLPELAAALGQVIAGRSCDDEKLAYRLEAAGLVRREGGKVLPRCTLYSDYFHQRLKTRG